MKLIRVEDEPAVSTPIPVDTGCYKLAVPFTYSVETTDLYFSVSSPYYSAFDEESVVLTEVLLTANTPGESLNWSLSYEYKGVYGPLPSPASGVMTSGNWTPAGENSLAFVLSTPFNVYHYDLIQANFVDVGACSGGGWKNISLLAYFTVNCGTVGVDPGPWTPPM